jgi:hypothetical protein
MSISNEEWQTLQDAWAIWEREKPELSRLDEFRTKARGQWPTGFQYIATIDSTGLTAITSIWDGDEGVDENVVTFTTEEILDIERTTAIHKAVWLTVEDERTKSAEERAKEARQRQYEALRKEFDEDGSA